MNRFIRLSNACASLISARVDNVLEMKHKPIEVHMRWIAYDIAPVILEIKVHFGNDVWRWNIVFLIR